MKQGIVICTWSGGRESVEALLDSLEGVNYPVIVVCNNASGVDWLDSLKLPYRIIRLDRDGYELGAIRAILEQTDLEEFVFFQDTFEVKNQGIFDILFQEHIGKSVAYNPHFQMYLGKFRREVLEKIEIPEVSTKAGAVQQEDFFTRAYREADPDTVVFNEHFIDQNFYGFTEERFGRTNIVMSDEYLVKRKGTWDASQIKD